MNNKEQLLKLVESELTKPGNPNLSGGSIDEQHDLLFRLFKQKQRDNIDALADTLKVRFNIQTILGVDAQDGRKSWEMSQQSERHQLFELVIQLEQERQVGRWLLSHPAKRGPKSKHLSGARTNPKLPDWVDHRRAPNYRKLALMPDAEWYEFLVKKWKSGTLSRQAAYDIADDHYGDLLQAAEDKREAAANKEYFGKPKSPRTKSPPSQPGQAYQRMCRIHSGDFMDLDMTAAPVERNEKPAAIICDPPYKDEYFEKDKEGRWAGESSVWERLAKWAFENIAPDGDFVVMVGTQWLSRAMATILAAGWQYRWTIAIKYKWFKFNRGKKVQPFWKPVLVFNKPGWNVKHAAGIDGDHFLAGKRIKNRGEWQQDSESFERLITNFTKSRQLVCDPCAGYGTTGFACIRRGRRFIGAEIIPSRCKQADEDCRTEFRKMKKQQKGK